MTLTMRTRRTLIALLCAGLSAPLLAGPRRAWAQSAAKRRQDLPADLADRLRFGWLGRSDVQEFLADIAFRHSMPRIWLDNHFEFLGAQPRAITLLNPPPPPPGEKPKPRSWARYLSGHVDAKQISNGKAFIETHQNTLARVARKTGVPIHVIAGIIGVETRYGTVTGRYPTLETLTTLAFESPRRNDFFKKELESLLVLGYQGIIDLETVQGSYAGALGMPQFMPSSWRNFAVSFHGQRDPDLLNNPDDAIASVGNFLKLHGWQRHEGTHSPAIISSTADPSAFIAPKLEPIHSVGLLKEAGITQETPRLSDQTKASLIDLPESNGSIQYWVAAKNFFVITQYNRSFMYAAAVLTLAEALSEASTKPAEPTPAEKSG
jgi:membrane-bound lytic murein transglycosylase B